MKTLLYGMGRAFRGLATFALAMLLLFMMFAMFSSIFSTPTAYAATGEVNDHRDFSNAFLTDARLIGKTTVVLGSQPTVTPPSGMVYVWLTVNGSSELVLNYMISNGTVKSGLAGLVPTTRTVGGNALSANVTNAMLKTSVLNAVLYSNELTPAGDALFLSAAQKAVVVGNTGTVKGGSVTVTAGDVSGGATAITTGLSTVASQSVQVLRANAAMYSETITVSGGTISVAGGSNYTLTEGDVIKYIAVGAL